MSDTHTTTTDEQIAAARDAALRLANTDETTRDEALAAMADALRAHTDDVLAANETDVERAEALLEQGEYSAALVDRLRLDAAKVDDIAAMVDSVAALDAPLGRPVAARQLDHGLALYDVSVPI